VLGCTLGRAAKGTLRTAEIVPSMAISAISFEPVAADSKSRKRARQIRIERTAVIRPQF
jgi:hypothetical protein